MLKIALKNFRKKFVLQQFEKLEVTKIINFLHLHRLYLEAVFYFPFHCSAERFGQGIRLIKNLSDNLSYLSELFGFRERYFFIHLNHLKR